jgi:hypothetical protein
MNANKCHRQEMETDTVAKRTTMKMLTTDATMSTLLAVPTRHRLAVGDLRLDRMSGSDGATEALETGIQMVLGGILDGIPGPHVTDRQIDG